MVNGLLKVKVHGLERLLSKNITERVEYIPRKLFCQLIYHELENIKGLTKEQYNASIKKYPVLGL